MDISGWTKDNYHRGDVEISEDLTVLGTITSGSGPSGGCIETDCIQTATASGDLSIKDSAGVEAMSIDDGGTVTIGGAGGYVMPTAIGSVGNHIEVGAGNQLIFGDPGSSAEMVAVLSNERGVFNIGVFESIALSWAGSTTIPSASLVTNDVIEVKATGKIVKSGQSPNVDGGSVLRLIFGNTFTVDCKNIALGTNTLDDRQIEFTWKTFYNGTKVFTSFSGGFWNNTNVWQTIDFTGSINTFGYTLGAGDQTLDVQWKNNNSFDDSFTPWFINTEIMKYTVSGATAPLSTNDHTLLSNLTSGDGGHTQFVELKGRSGGQSIAGGTLTTQTLTLRANEADTTTGTVQILSDVVMNAKKIIDAERVEGAGSQFIGMASTGDTILVEPLTTGDGGKTEFRGSDLEINDQTGSEPVASFATSDSTNDIIFSKELKMGSNAISGVGDVGCTTLTMSSIDTALGDSATVTAATRGVAVGSNAQATGASSVALGGGIATFGPTAVAAQSIAIGQNADCPNALKTGGIAIGSTSNCSNNYGVAIGMSAQSTNTNSVAIGGASDIANAADASGDKSVAIGYNTTSSQQWTIAVGRTATADANRTIAIGNGAMASTLASVALGDNTDAITGAYATAIGSFAQATGSNSVALGGGADAGDSANASEAGSIAIGRASLADGASNSIAIGSYSDAGGDRSIAIGGGAGTGSGASAANDYGIALGYNASVGATDSIAIGKNATTSTANQMVLGGPSSELTTIVPGTDAATDLGSSSNRFKDMYSQTLTASTTAYTEPTFPNDSTHIDTTITLTDRSFVGALSPTIRWALSDTEFDPETTTTEYKIIYRTVAISGVHVFIGWSQVDPLPATDASISSPYIVLSYAAFGSAPSITVGGSPGGTISVNDVATLTSFAANDYFEFRVTNSCQDFQMYYHGTSIVASPTLFYQRSGVTAAGIWRHVIGDNSATNSSWTVDTVAYNSGSVQSDSLLLNPTVPSDPVKGKIAYNSATNKLNYYDGADWTDIHPSAFIHRQKSAAQSIPMSTWTKVTWPVSAVAGSGGLSYDGVDAIAVTKAGQYLFTAEVGLQERDYSAVNAFYNINSTTSGLGTTATYGRHNWFYDGSTTAFPRATVSFTLNLAANDKVRLWIFFTTTTSGARNMPRSTDISERLDLTVVRVG